MENEIDLHKYEYELKKRIAQETYSTYKSVNRFSLITFVALIVLGGFSVPDHMVVAGGALFIAAILQGIMFVKSKKQMDYLSSKYEIKDNSPLISVGK